MYSIIGWNLQLSLPCLPSVWYEYWLISTVRISSGSKLPLARSNGICCSGIRILCRSFSNPLLRVAQHESFATWILLPTWFAEMSPHACMASLAHDLRASGINRLDVRHRVSCIHEADLYPNKSRVSVSGSARDIEKRSGF